MKRIVTSICTFAIAAALAVPGVAAVPAKRSVPSAVPDAITHHTLVLAGKTLHYTARAGLIALRDGDVKRSATMFYTAYTLDGTDANKRPITFFYNGGPGSATIWLRMGSFGPVRVVAGNGRMTGPAPFHLVNNQYTLLDKTDLVFVDMPGSGYGRILDGGNPKNIFGSDNDVRAFGQFIERYLTNNNRWNSPKFLFGESYGTPRSAMLAAYLQTQGVTLNGVVLQSSILNYGLASPDTYAGADTDDWQYIFFVPTEAAANWYFNPSARHGETLEAFEHSAADFAMGEYRVALAQGAALAPAEYDRIVTKLHELTGLSQRYIRNSNLRISGSRFQAQYQRNQGETLGAYDARYRLFTLDQESPQATVEPTDEAITGAYVATQNTYMRDVLHYDTPLMYLTGAYQAIAASGGWDFKHRGELPLNTAGDLQAAMTTNPHLRIFSANGYYDSVTPWLATVYTLEHLDLQPRLVSNITYGFYPSGHMIYLNTEALAQWHADLERWYSVALR